MTDPTQADQGISKVSNWPENWHDDVCLLAAVPYLSCREYQSPASEQARAAEDQTLSGAEPSGDNP